MTSGKQKLTLILAGGASLLLLAIFLLLNKSVSTPIEGDPSAGLDTTLQQDLWNVDPNDPDQIRDVFELRFGKIEAATARVALAEFKLDGFALKPLQTMNSVVERECLPRVRALKERGTRIPAENLEPAVPGHLLHGDPLIICRDLVAAGLKQARPGLEALDGNTLWTALAKVDALSANYFKGKPANKASFDGFAAARQSALGDPELDSTLFSVQDEHTRLGFDFDAFVTGEAAELPVDERLRRYESMARAFKQKSGIALQRQDPEPRDHLNRALRLLELDEQYDEERRYELIKSISGEKAARLDQEEREATGEERRNLASFESERDELYAGINAAPGTPAYDRRAAEIEADLTEKYFNE